MYRTIIVLALFLVLASIAESNAKIIPKRDVIKRSNRAAASLPSTSGSGSMGSGSASGSGSGSGSNLLGGINLTNLLTPGGTLCTAIMSIPAIGQFLASILCKSGGGTITLPTITLPPINIPTLTAPTGGMMKPLSSLNFIACPVLTFINSVPVVGTTFVSSFNPAFFGCPITSSGNNMMMNSGNGK